MNDYFDLKVGLTNFVFSVFSPHLALGLLGMLYISVFERTAFAEIKLLYVWVLGLLLCCFFIPCADQFICRTLEVIPLQIDLVRGVRYLIPLSEIIFIASLALFSNRFNLFSRRLACSAGIALVLIIWPPPLDEIIKTVSHWGSGDLHLKPSAHAQATIQNLKEISRLVPEEALIHVDSGIDPILVRSIAHRSVAFVDKDQGVLFYGNHLGLLRWAQLRKELEEMAQPPARFFELIPWAKLHGISYIIVDYEPPEKSANSSPNFWKIIYPESSLDSNRTSTPGMYLIRLD